MTETIEKNKLLAEFMGFVNTTPTDKDFNIMEHPDTGEMQEPMSMKYHTSWDWLMPVVEKCLISCNEEDNQYALIHDALFTINIDEVYRAIVGFIKWYNENSKDNG